MVDFDVYIVLCSTPDDVLRLQKLTNEAFKLSNKAVYKEITEEETKALTKLETNFLQGLNLNGTTSPA